MSLSVPLDLNTCRLCLSQEGLLPLFSDIETPEGGFNSLHKKILACVSIEVSSESNLPKNICEVCKKSIDDWEKFKEQCHRVNSTLLQFVESHKSAEYVETLRNNLGGAASALLFSDVDVSIFERESLFGGLEDGLQVDGGHDVLNISLSDDLLSENPQSSTLRASSVIENLLATDEDFDIGNLNTFQPIKGPSECENQYPCGFCEEVFSGFSKLLEHDDSSHNTLPKTCVCQVCGEKFLSESRINLHVGENKCNKKVVTSKAERFPCGLCEKDFPKFCRLLRHDDSYHPDVPKTFSCKLCDEQFVSQSRIDVHIRRHRSRITGNSRDHKQYACGLCEEVFSKFANLLRHDDTYHAKLTKNFICQVCGKTFLEESRIDVHMRFHDERKFRCVTCGKMFLSPKSLSVHARGHEDRFVCEFCGVKKQSMKIMEDHIRMHTKEKPFECKMCGKTFSTYQCKAVHERICHSDNRNFKCDICDYRTYSSSMLNIHKQSHNKDKQFKCNHCDKLFKTYATYFRHSKTHSKLNPSYKCLVCSAVFRQKYLLRRHEALHLNLRQFTCYICDKSYNRKDLLNAHVLLHMSKRTHSCDKCGRKFKTATYLKKHNKIECSVKKISVEPHKTNINNVDDKLIVTNTVDMIDLYSNNLNLNNVDDGLVVTNPIDMANLGNDSLNLNNIDDRLVFSNAPDFFDQGNDNLNNSYVILNNDNIMLYTPPAVSVPNTTQSVPLTVYLVGSAPL